jgi:hypothetical protein
VTSTVTATVTSTAMTSTAMIGARGLQSGHHRVALRRGESAIVDQRLQVCGQALARLGPGAIIGRHGRVSSGERGDDGIDLGRIQGAVVHEALQHLAKLGLALGRIAVTAAVTTTVMLASDVTVGSIDRRRGCTAISARV